MEREEEYLDDEPSMSGAAGIIDFPPEVQFAIEQVRFSFTAVITNFLNYFVTKKIHIFK
jgi:hypothetical protein